jgi:intracellular sulfur oxidation DsrE/DsrF family protein
MQSDGQWSRRTLVRLGAAGGALAAVAALGASPTEAHNLPGDQAGSPQYEAALTASGGMKALFQTPQIEATSLSGKVLNHMVLIQARNWLNAFQFSYNLKPADLHTIVATYASANLITYADAVWEKYKLGEKYNLIDPETNAPLVRNPFWASRNDPTNTADPTDPKSFYLDPGIEALQKRGTVFITCHQAIHAHAAAAVADKRAPAGMDAAAVVADIQANLVPGGTVVPAGVADVSRIQQAGYTLIFVPDFRT